MRFGHKVRILTLPVVSHDGSCLGPSSPPPKPDRKGPSQSQKQYSFMVSFYAGVSSPHLHRHVYFTEPLFEIVRRSLRLSCRLELT
ncbi:hypothetical protein HPP92_006199 [Vanilla planifolia]|uniref:Uncharacterized protein n=1 Tax=Vanilla planifolia TaxID=51239 RepID=A0A835VFL1_VANPL|nr:hypothetical protein HPP92_006199 [Vanilla planifolia]